MYAGSDATLITTNGHETHTVFVGMGTPDGEPILPMNRRAFCRGAPPHQGAYGWQVVPLTAIATPGTGRACPDS